MESGSDPSEAVFLVLGCLTHLICLSRGMYLALMHWQQLCKLIRSAVADLRYCAKGFNYQEAPFLEAKVTNLRVRVAHIYVHLLLLVSGPLIAWTIWVMWQGRSRLTEPSRWAILIFFVAGTVHFIRPRVLSAANASYWYVAVMAMGLVGICAAMDELRSRETAAPHEAAVAPLFFAFFFRVRGQK